MFDLRKFLTEHKLTQNSLLLERAGYAVFRIEHPDSSAVHYAKAVMSQTPTPESWFRKYLSATESTVGRGGKIAPVGHLLLKHPDIEEWKLSIVGQGLEEKEALELKMQSIKEDPNSISGGAVGKTSGKLDKGIKVPKDQSISIGGKVFVSDLYLHKNPDFAKQVKDNLGKVSQHVPGKGSYRELISSNVKRV